MPPGWSWVLLWFIAALPVPKRKQQRGYAWRLLRRLPPWRWVNGEGFLRQLLRFMLLVTLLWGAIGPFLSDPLDVAAIYSILIVMELDDYLNGDDDDRKRRREWARNKIRWLMDLPKQPQEVRDAA
jgi:hypothetical protein